MRNTSSSKRFSKLIKNNDAIKKPVTSLIDKILNLTKFKVGRTSFT